jgi:hypothetical protein
MGDKFEYATLDIIPAAKVAPRDVSMPRDLARVWVMAHGHSRIGQLGVDEPGGDNDTLSLLNHVGRDGWQLCAETVHIDERYPNAGDVLEQLRDNDPPIVDLAPRYTRLWLKRLYREPS